MSQAYRHPHILIGRGGFPGASRTRTRGMKRHRARGTGRKAAAAHRDRIDHRQGLSVFRPAGSIIVARRSVVTAPAWGPA